MKVLILLLFCFAIASCKKFVTIDPPPTQLEASTIFANDQAAISAVVGLYSKMTETNLYVLNGGLTLYPGLSADEIYRTSANSATDEFQFNNLTVSNTLLQNNLWRFSYSYIYHANAIIEGLAASTSITDSLKKQLEGEALVIRSLCYFYLTNMFGDVPLVLTTDFRKSSVQPRAPQNEIYGQIKADLIRAKTFLSANYAFANRTRANNYTAASLLARVYLYLGDWTNAETEASLVINSGLYTLISSANIASTFLYNSAETIWQLSRDNIATSDGATFLPTSPTSTTKPTYALTTFLMQEFQTIDLRKKNWIDSIKNSGVTYYYPKKYRLKTFSTTTPVASTEFYIAFRLAEIYLIRSEARAQLNNLTGSLDDLNKIRTRAAVPLINSNDKAAILGFIERERQLELFAEWGHRWFDLKRTNRADAVLSVRKTPNWQQMDALYPIPIIEIEKNPALTQNQGY